VPPKPREQSVELARLAVDIGDDVIQSGRFPFLHQV